MTHHNKNAWKTHLVHSAIVVSYLKTAASGENFHVIIQSVQKFTFDNYLN